MDMSDSLTKSYGESVPWDRVDLFAWDTAIGGCLVLVLCISLVMMFWHQRIQQSIIVWGPWGRKRRLQEPVTGASPPIEPCDTRGKHLKARWNLLMQALPIGVFEADIAGRCRFLSPTCAEILGVSFLDAFVGSWLDHLHSEDRAVTFENWRSAWERQESFVAECRVIARHGGVRWIQVRGTPLSTNEGWVYVGTVEDISEQRRNARQIQLYTESLEKLRRLEQEKNRQLEAAMAAEQQARQEFEQLCQVKSDFLASMSHEIRTPMTSILGFTDVMIEEGGRVLPSDSPLITVKRNAEYLLELLNDILDLSKIEAGRLEVERVPADPMSITEEVIEMLSVRLRGRDLELRLKVDHPFPRTIDTDPTRLKQILVNLVGNSIKFTERGSIDVHLSVEPHEIPDSNGKSEQQLVMRVTDTGIGMSAEQIARLFKPFSQAGVATTRQYGGTGLGLTICKELVIKMGGQIQVDSEQGVGTTFTVILPAFSARHEELPANHAMVPGTPAPVQSSNQLLEGTRILVAEDSPDNQRLLKFLLNKAGADVSLVSNGKEVVLSALNALQNDSAYDAILIDMQMPVLDGYAATRQLRDAGYPGVIVALTAHSLAGDRERCLESGCTEYSQKPIDRVRLLELLNRLIVSRRVQGAATCSGG